MSVRANPLSLPYLDRHLKLAKINSCVRRGRAVIPCWSRGMSFLLAYVRPVAGGDVAAQFFIALFRNWTSLLNAKSFGRART
jgi:hypothetical protein